MKTMLLMMLGVMPLCAVANETELKERVAGMARMVDMRGFQISSRGITGEATVKKPKQNPSRNKGAAPYLWTVEIRHDAVIRKAEGAKVMTMQDSSAVPAGGKAFITEDIVWKGKAWRIGSIRYRTTRGINRTVPLYTASEVEAVNFFRKHGFTQSAKDAVMVDE